MQAWGSGRLQDDASFLYERACVNYEPLASTLTLGLQIAQSRSYLYTLGPKVGIIYILGALGLPSLRTYLKYALFCSWLLTALQRGEQASSHCCGALPQLPNMVFFRLLHFATPGVIPDS